MFANTMSDHCRADGRKTIGVKKRVTVAFSVDQEVKDKLQRLADEQGVSMSEYINRWAKTL